MKSTVLSTITAIILLSAGPVSAYEVTDKPHDQQSDHQKEQIKKWRKVKGSLYKKLMKEQQKGNCVFSTSPLSHQEKRSDVIMDSIDIRDITTMEIGRNKWKAAKTLYIRCHFYPGRRVYKYDFNVRIDVDGRQASGMSVPRSKYKNGSIVFTLTPIAIKTLGNKALTGAEVMFNITQRDGGVAKNSVSNCLKGWCEMKTGGWFAVGKFRFTGMDRNGITKSAKERFADKSSKRRVRPVPVKQANCNTYISGYDAKIYKFVCPSNCRVTGATTLKGTDEYSKYTSVCLAAVHAGVLKKGQGGEVTIQVNRGRYRQYTGSKRNGLTSTSDGTNGESFTFVK
ncbi:hypothetical protein KKF34_16400 [Myxococcota bacterium]|nr:hypothetical protein [Myxococcota bacterium]MBU1382309.1 hypothetical protein [Myxococcota bacterium]MBU1498459.1 hypothetical protein [Myxococcota bacterium]